MKELKKTLTKDPIIVNDKIEEIISKSLNKKIIKV